MYVTFIVATSLLRPDNLLFEGHRANWRAWYFCGFFKLSVGCLRTSWNRSEQFPDVSAVDLRRPMASTIARSLAAWRLAYTQYCA